MVGRPKKETQTVAKIFKITPEQDVKLNKILANQYNGGNDEEDRSHIVRLALENYFDEFYSEVL